MMFSSRFQRRPVAILYYSDERELLNLLIESQTDNNEWCLQKWIVVPRARYFMARRVDDKLW